MRDLTDDVRIEISVLRKPKCMLYEPLSETEGMCYDGSTVNISGCENPEICDRYKNFKNFLEYHKERRLK